MAENLTLSEKVIKMLSEHSGERFTARKIAEWVMENYKSACQEKKERTGLKDDKALLNQLRAEINSGRLNIQKNAPAVKTTEDRPRQYYWTEKTDEEAVDESEKAAPRGAGATAQGGSKNSERALYPMLSEYLWSEYKIYPLRINEGTSSNKQGRGGNEWLHPDLVGMENLTAEWREEIKGVVKEAAGKKTRLWSFEVKELLNRSNVRKAYFQAVSNSSWAGFGYLAAARIEGSNIMRELQMLAALHGIGLIQIDTESPTDSEIVIPARERLEVDWTTCNRLADENKDFRQFINLVRQFYQTDDPRPNDWDLPKNWDSDD